MERAAAAGPSLRRNATTRITTAVRSEPARRSEEQQQRRVLVTPRRQQTCVCHATDPYLMQDVIMGSAVVAAVGAALSYGLKQDDQVCPSCAGSGGVRCFACEGSGKMDGIKLEELAANSAAAKREIMGRKGNKRECVACKGAGMLFCKRCSGSGYAPR